MKSIFIKLCTGSIIFSACNTNQRPIHQKPNIIFIITDDQQTGLLGLEGNPVVKTPNIDRIGNEGVIFRNFFAVTPLSSPSRASFLTGQYAHKHGVINNDKVGMDVISHTLMTWPRQLHEAGYKTAFIGKWHMGLDDSRRPGFDRWLSFKGQGIYINGVVNDDGFQRQIKGYMTDYINDQAAAFIKMQSKKNEPFAMVVSHKAIHWPILPAKEYDSSYAGYEFKTTPPGEDDLKGKPLLTRAVTEADWSSLEGIVPEPAEPRRDRGMDPASIVRDQLHCLRSVDDGAGAIFDALDKIGQLDNTIIIFTSDNGMLMGEHGQVNVKRWAYDPAIRVPLLIRYPKIIPPGSTRDQMLLNIDIAPTLLELAGVKSIIPLHGQSFVPVLNNADAVGRKSFLAEYFLEKVNPGNPSWKAVRTEQFKYIRYSDDTGGIEELYDLKADPHEENNLIADPSSKSIAEDLRQQLDKLLLETM